MEEPKSYSIEKLNESNYRSWSQVVESHLDDQGLWEVVKGEEKRPEYPPTATLTTATAATPTTEEVAANKAAKEEYEAKLETWTKKAKKARKMILSNKNKGGARAHIAKMARNIDPNDEEEPATVQEAINHPTRGKQWEKAVKDEVNSLMKNESWDYASRPRNHQVVSCKFIFKHKKNEIAQIVRLKARLVARGFSQIYSVDYLDTKMKFFTVYSQ
jgi:Reverse transcriptase (RNA-dependent DNA polymerase)/Domain of unknown function (DUF4219)